MKIVSIRNPVFFVQICILLNVSPYLVHCLLSPPPPSPPVSKLQLPPGGIGPEAITFDKEGGGPYTGVSDGRVLKYEGEDVGFTDFATTAPNRSKLLCDGVNDPVLQNVCGRPFGIVFYNKTGDLYITDGYYGLLVVGPNGGRATQLVTGFEGKKFVFLNALDIDQEFGVIYFLDSGLPFRTGNRLLITLSRGDTSGRLYKYDIGTKQVTLLLAGLSGPAGVVLSDDNSYLLISEYIAGKIRRFYLNGEKANTWDIFKNVEGNPDNIKRTVSGAFRVAIVTLKLQLIIPTFTTVAQKFDQFGNVLETLNFTQQFETGITEALEYNGKLYLGSLDKRFLGVATSLTA